MWCDGSLSALAGNELHVALECPAYADLGALHGPLFASLLPVPELAMRLMLCPPEFPPQAGFRRDHLQTVECVAGCRPHALSLESDLPVAFVVPHACLMSFPEVGRLCLLVVGWLVVA